MRSSFRACALILVALLTACGGGGNNVTPVEQATTPPPSSSADCPASGAVPQAAQRSSESLAHGRVPSGALQSRYVPGAIAVQYRGVGALTAIESHARAFAAARISDLNYGAMGVRSRVLSVDPANVDAAMRSLRALPGVQSVTRVAYRQRLSITANDPYYTGYPASTAPYYETSATHGQWDMHVINLDGAWSLFSGSAPSAAPIAVVDTGVDLTHPELGGGRVTRAQCYVTYPSGSAQSSGPYVTDTDGHGTNVAGIADAFSNNNFGFTGTAYNAPLLAYRIFPSDPPGGCDVNKPPAQCDSDTVDEASAINDAVAHGAKVINLSLGGDPPCNTGDPEYVAVENAIKAGVVVVAAAGNGDASTGVGYSYLDCPAADPGVIAVGASALNDAAFPTVSERIASYSNYLTTNGTQSGGAFLLAPGGDVTSASDPDNLHWIQNIYSTTAYDAGNRATCTGGADNFGQQGDCNVEIVGTSMAVPHVAGVVALMLGINHALTPQQIATGLCSSADPIGDPKQGCGRVDAAAAVSWAQTH